ncbi:hypothetical protein L228DRAFT_260618 [Xylona heveae TC161]|uniref:Uncharacterized protein n=1 Tax=Xylona heveae (strain CBS 132557 / TC161) TaxID=1328760 RepID=A0A165HRI9_XYLHT|nr:hypothetical protein L228DRAFT_260618 [Xylona heveae TC161]KZF23864.1 hypothetical protein L228DRAFT_260618 [Xylona heveae TC161]
MKFGLLFPVGLAFASQLVSAWNDGFGGIAPGYFSIEVPEVGQAISEPAPLHPGSRCYSDSNKGVQIKYGAQYLDATVDTRCGNVRLQGTIANTARRCIIPVSG